MHAFEESCRRLRGENVDALVLTPLAVLDFLCIHPFLDGNGRIGRLLTLLMLYQGGHSVGRFISLERIVEESKDSYYEALERSSTSWHEGAHDALPWIRYFWGVMTKAYGRFEERVGERSGRGSKRERIRAAVGRRITPFGIAEIETECPDCSRDMVRLVLREMRDEGLLRAESSGRGARWVKVEGGVRIVSCPLPVKAPWLNAIEPKWVHGKRAILEPDRKLSGDEVIQRVCSYYGCEHLECLEQQVA